MTQIVKLIDTLAIGREPIGEDAHYSCLAESFGAAGEVLDAFDLEWAESCISERFSN